MARQLCQPGARLLCMARHSASGLERLAAERGAELVQWVADLAQPAVVANRLLAYLARADFGAQPVADVRDA